MTLLTPLSSVICKSISETADYYCIVRLSRSGYLSLSNLFGIFMSILGPSYIEQIFLVCFKGFGENREAKILQQFAIIAILWCIWLEWNAHITKSSLLALKFALVYGFFLTCLQWPLDNSRFCLLWFAKGMLPVAFLPNFQEYFFSCFPSS